MALFRSIGGPGRRHAGGNTIDCDFGPFDVGPRLCKGGVGGKLKCGGEDGIDVGGSGEE